MDTPTNIFRTGPSGAASGLAPALSAVEGSGVRPLASSLAGVPLRPGLILNMSCNSPYGPFIRLSLAPAYERLTHDPHPIRNCPSHSAMIVKNDGKLWIGEAKRPIAVLTSVEQYQEDLRTGHVYGLPGPT